MMKRVMLCLSLIAGSACGRSAGEEAPPSKENRIVSWQVSNGEIDSAIPIPEALDRFRQGLEQPSRLGGGSVSREQLVRRFVRALEHRDTLALGNMVVGIAEFAWFYYPSSPLARRPYELAPALMWFQLQGESSRGAAKLLDERGGQTLGYLDHACGNPRVEGENRLYPYCGLRRVTETGDTVTERLFGLILERGGTYKFLSYANRL
jgi:hypothetical protein